MPRARPRIPRRPHSRPRRGRRAGDRFPLRGGTWRATPSSPERSSAVAGCSPGGPPGATGPRSKASRAPSPTRREPATRMGAVLLESATPVGGHDHQIDRAVEAAPVYAGLSFCFGVRCAQDDLARELDGALAPLRTDAEPSHWYTLVRTANGEVEVRLDGVAVVRARDGWWASRWLMWHVNRAVVDATCEHLLLHAGAVVTRGAGVLIPGAPGAGKSTLVAGLVQRGCGYLT